jgi:hypothetical protein
MRAVKALTPRAGKALAPRAAQVLAPRVAKALAPRAAQALAPRAVKALFPRATQAFAPLVSTGTSSACSKGTSSSVSPFLRCTPRRGVRSQPGALPSAPRVSVCSGFFQKKSSKKKRYGVSVYAAVPMVTFKCRDESIVRMSFHRRGIAQ